MDFKKIREYVKPNIGIDVEGARENELRYNFDIGNDKTWRILTPADFPDEKAIARRINNLFDQERSQDT